MASFGMLRRVALVSSSKMPVLTRATLRNIPEDAILHSHRRENLKCYSDGWFTLWCLGKQASVLRNMFPFSALSCACVYCALKNF
jgi:hypothetical protein